MRARRDTALFRVCGWGCVQRPFPACRRGEGRWKRGTVGMRGSNAEWRSPEGEEDGGRTLRGGRGRGPDVRLEREHHAPCVRGKVGDKSIAMSGVRIIYWLQAGPACRARNSGYRQLDLPTDKAGFPRCPHSRTIVNRSVAHFIATLSALRSRTALRCDWTDGDDV